MGDKNSGRADIIISVAMQMKDTAKQLDAQIKKATRNAGTKMTKNLRKQMSGAKAFDAKMFELKQILPKKQFDAVNTEFKKLGKTVDGSMTPPLKRLNIAHKKVAGQMKARTKKLQGSFKAWALGIMFFGMAIQRAMNQIWQFGSKAFNEISHSVEGTTTGFDMLTGSMKYLGFVVGQALEPLAMALIPIIMSISDWVERNPKLVSQLVKVGSVIGAILFVVGTLVLGFSSLGTAFTNVVIALSDAGPVVADIFEGMSVSVLGAIAIIAGIIVVAVAMWKTNFGGFRDFITVVFGDIWKYIKKVFNFIYGIVKDVVDLLVAIFSGDSDEILRILKRMGARIVNFLVDTLAFIIALVHNVTTFIMNLVVDIVFKIIVGLVKAVIDAWSGMIKFILEKAASLWTSHGKKAPKWITNSIAGIDKMSDGLDSVVDKVQKFGDSIKGDFMSADDVKAKFGIEGDLIDMGQFDTVAEKMKPAEEAMLKASKAMKDAVDKTNKGAQEIQINVSKGLMSEEAGKAALEKLKAESEAAKREFNKANAIFKAAQNEVLSSDSYDHSGTTTSNVNNNITMNVSSNEGGEEFASNFLKGMQSYAPSTNSSMRE